MDRGDHPTTSPESLPLRADALPNELAEKLALLQQSLRELGSAIVAFSGGVDSALLLAVAHDTLGVRCLGLTAVSPSLAPSELAQCERVAAQIGARWERVETSEIDDPRYVRNPEDRCYFCKSHLFDVAEVVRAREGAHAILLGTNADDLGDHRPGLRAAQERGVLSPMLDVGLTKAEVRALAHHRGLPVWDKPAMACLASRVPYHTPITAERLERIAACEAVLVELQFAGARARFHGETVRIEVRPADLSRAVAPEVRAALVAGCKAAGFRFVVLDLEGYRRGVFDR